MVVIATAGHVDHGKSALVRALTGMEPDRLAEERRRGLTIDLGYAWTTLESGHTVAFVDVPGHQRFIGTMLAGIGPAAAVLFVVAADEGWRRQSTEHLAAIDALGIRHGVLVVTRSDLADPTPALAEARARLARSCLRPVPGLAVSARTGQGLAELLVTLTRLAGHCASAVAARPKDNRTRLWLDRAFTLRGAGTIVTGTLAEGRLASTDTVRLVTSSRCSPPRIRGLRIRGLHSLDRSVDVIDAPARVAVNLPGVESTAVSRGSVLLTGEWRLTDTVDVRVPPIDPPKELMLHIGTHAAHVRVRPLGAGAARLHLPIAVPLLPGDRGILRSPGAQQVVGGAEVLDIDPPPLRRRGAAAERANQLRAGAGAVERLAADIERRGAVTIAELVRLGHEVGAPPPGVRRVGGWLVDAARWQSWVRDLRTLLAARAEQDPLSPELAQDAVVSALGLADRELLATLAPEAGARLCGGRVSAVGVVPHLGDAERGLAAIERRLAAEPWAAPEQRDLETAGLGPRELAAAVRLGRIVRLPGDIVLLPDAPALAMRVLAAVAQPFTLSEARQALGTTRRVAVPLLEHLDSLGWTRRVDGGRRTVSSRLP